MTTDEQHLIWHVFRKFLFHHFQPFQLLEYQWREGKFDEQTSSKPRTVQQVYDWGNLNASNRNIQTLLLYFIEVASFINL